MDGAILVVDDDTDLRETLGELLEEEGYPVRLCQNGREALDLLQSGERPRLILLDLMMPQMNGWQFREEQLRDDELRQIPVVIMTASAGGQQVIMASEVLPKPVGIHKVLDAVARNAA